jgi:hypothetical protein
MAKPKVRRKVWLTYGQARALLRAIPSNDLRDREQEEAWDVLLEAVGTSEPDPEEATGDIAATGVESDGTE